MPPHNQLTQPQSVAPNKPVNSQRTLASEAVAVSRPAIRGYEILGELGRGGMGVVYRARQTALGREVALKMILGGAHAGAADLDRFHSEAQAVAALRHPNIVQIYEIGEHDGRPFFSLEFMDGGSLHDRLDGTPQSPRGSARLIELLARAMQTAHGHGIVHRDLKPGNILLQKSEVGSQKSAEKRNSSSWLLGSLFLPKISDFGLAKRLDNENSQTRTGAVLGTPSYMAPEQAAGSKGVGPAADIYALGAILYDLLTGRPPFRGENELDTLIQVSTEEPVPPRRLQPKVPRDLETICLKCLEKQPRRRYETAAALADDLARFLSGRPIQARPVGRVERAVKWTRRKPALAALGLVSVLAAVALLAGGVFHTLQLREAVRQADSARADAEKSARDARQQKERAEQQSQRAADNFRRARAAVDQMLTRIATEELANLPHMETLRETILADALRYYEEFLKEKGDDPEVCQEAGRAYRRIGDIDLLLNKHAEARMAYAQALALQQQLVAAHPNVAPFRQDLAGSYHHRANLSAALGEAEKAEADYGRARELLAKLVADVPANTAFQLDLASLCNSLGTLLQDNSRMDEAHVAFSEARDLLAKSADPAPEFRQELAVTFNNLGSLHRSLSEPVKARAAYRRAIALYESLRKDRPAVADYRLELARGHINLGTLLRPLAKPMNSADAKAADESEKQFNTAIELCGKLAQDFPKVPKFRQQLANGHLNLGLLLRRCGRIELANEAFLQALEIRQKLVLEFQGVPNYRQELARSLTSVAVALRIVGKADETRKLEARRLFDTAVAMDRELVETYPKVHAYRSDLGNSLAQLATMLRRNDQLSESRRVCTEAIEMQRSALALNPTNPVYRRLLRSHYGDLADTLIRMDDLAGAAAAAESIPPIFPKHVDVYFRAAHILCRCSNHARDANRPGDAKAFADRAMAVLQKAKAKGIIDAEPLRRENLRALQQRSDYQKLLAELDQKKRKLKK